MAGKQVALMGVLAPGSTVPAADGSPVADCELRIEIDVDLPGLMGDEPLAHVELADVRAAGGVSRHAATAAQAIEASYHRGAGGGATAGVDTAAVASVDDAAHMEVQTAAVAVRFDLSLSLVKAAWPMHHPLEVADARHRAIAAALNSMVHIHSQRKIL